MTTETIHIYDIDATDRLRPIDPAHVELIAASIEQRGIEQPIVVRKRPASSPSTYILIVGGHRFEAMRALGWTELTIGKHVLVTDVDELEARLMEIDENIARRNLNALDRALFLAERQKVYAERNRTLGRGGDRKSKQFNEKINSESFRIDFSDRFSEDAAKRTGYSESTIQKALTLAKRLDKAAIAEIRGTPIEDNQNELFQLAELGEADQRKVAARIKSGEAKSVGQAKVAAGLAKPQTVDPQARVLAALLENWDKASKPTRAAFLANIGAQIAPKAEKAA